MHSVDRATGPGRTPEMALQHEVSDPTRLAAVRRTGLLDTGPEEAFDRLTRLAATLIGAPFAFVTLVDGTRSFWKSCVGVASADRESPVERSFCRYVIGSGTELVVTDTTTDARIRAAPSLNLMGVRAWAGFPLLGRNGQILGTFSAADTVARAWTPHDLAILDTLAHAAAGEIALRTALADARAATRIAELATAEAQQAALRALDAAEEAALLSRTLQESLLPPHLPTIPGLQVAARYLRGGRGADVLGDFYDVFHSLRDSWGVVVGDVSGKGPQAAKTTALARYTLRAAAVRSAVPSVILTTLNNALLEWFTLDTQFLTAVYATIRCHRLGFTAKVSCGGHDPAMIRRADGTVETLGVPGLILGCLPDPQLRDQRTLLRPGDSLVMHTDGVTEARRPADREMFGTDRLHGVLADRPVISAVELATRIETTVLDFSGRLITDDTAILVLHVPTNVGPG